MSSLEDSFPLGAISMEGATEIKPPFPLRTVSLFPKLCGDEVEFVAFKRSNHFSFDIYSIVLLIVLQLSMFSTRLALYRAFSLSVYFTAVLVMGDVCLVLFWLIVAVTLSQRYLSAVEYPLIFYYTQRIVDSSLYQESVDFLTILCCIAVSFYLYARVIEGTCPSETNIWLSQQCNPVARAGSIPQDAVLACYLTPVISQLLFKCVRFRTIVLGWAMMTAIVTRCIIRVDGWVEIYTILYSFFFLYINFEVERFMRVAYAQTLSVLAQTERERKLENLRRDQEFAAERARVELHILTMQGAHDKRQAEQEKRMMEKERDHLRSLIGNVAHDLKTPIQAISMGVEVLRSECIVAFTPAVTRKNSTLSIITVSDTGDEEGKDGLKSRDSYPIASHASGPSPIPFELPFEELFRSMFATCRFMTMAINRSIDFTKASSNIQLVPSLETVDFFETLCVPVDCIRNLQANVDVVIAPLPLEMCPHVITDKHWLAENVLCVLSNAVKYSTGGVVNVNTVLTRIGDRLEEEPVPLMGDSGYFIRVTIIDNGIGISEEKRKILFQPFIQAQRSAGGTGLGLFSLLKRMEALGGSCGIESRQDGEQGSEFWFTFPYRPDPTAGSRAGGDDEGMRTPDTNNTGGGAMGSGVGYRGVGGSVGGGLGLEVPDATWAIRRLPPSDRSFAELNRMPLRILIIEDSLSIVKITTRLLVTKGHIVESAINGSIGLDRLIEVFGTEDDFDMVLSDLQMPVMDGFECVRRYRAYEAKRKSLALFQAQGQLTPTTTLALSDRITTSITNATTISSFTSCAPSPTNGTTNGSIMLFESEESRSMTSSRRPSVVSDSGKGSWRSVVPTLGLGGVGGLGRMGAARARDNMAIVGMSANSDSGSARAALDIGMNIFITKPFTGADLQNILNLFDINQARI